MQNEDYIVDREDDYDPIEAAKIAEEERKKSIKIKGKIKELKHYLRGAWYYQKKKDFLSEKILMLRSKAEKITTTFSDVPTFGGFEDHRQAVIAEMVDNQKKYENIRKECANRLQEIEFFIGLLDDYQEKLVLQYRYIYYENWQDIAIALNYHERAIFKVHGRALLHLLEIHQKMIENGKGLF